MSQTGVDRKIITVFGGRHPIAGDEEYVQAVRLGALLASANYSVMSGGYSGIMEAVSRGASQGGAAAIGVTMEIFGELPANPFLTQEIRSRNFFERLEILAERAAGFVALRGGMGTLTEVGLIWNMIQTRTLGSKPLILVGKFWKPLLQSMASHLVISASDLRLLHTVDGVEDAVARLVSVHSQVT